MKSKKALTGVLVLGLILSSSAAAFADSQAVYTKEAYAKTNVSSDEVTRDSRISEEEAIKLGKKYVKEFFNIDIDNEQFEMNAHNRVDMGASLGIDIWNLNFYQYRRDKSLGIDLSINGNSGKLISIYKWDHNMLGQNQVSSFTREEAKEIAKEFLKSRHNDILEELQLDESYFPNYIDEQGLRPTDYRFNFRRHNNGIPVLYDGVNIGINSGSGEITSYSFTWREEALPEKGDVISKEKAQQLIEDSMDVTLNYIPVRDMNDPYYNEIKEVKLAYSQTFKNGTQIDAETGKFINYTQNDNDEVRKKDLTKEEKLEIARLANNIVGAREIVNKEEAKKVAEKILNEIYNEEITIKNISYSSNIRMNNKPYKSWEIQFGFGDSTSEGYMSLDASNGRLVNLHYYNWHLRDLSLSQEKDFEKKLTWEEAYDKAIEVLKTLYPDRLKSTETEQVYRQSYYYYNDKRVEDIEYYFNFNRQENGAIFSSNYLSISIDTATGRVQNIYMNWDDVKLPKMENIIDKEIAKEIFIKELDIKLAYSYIYFNDLEAKEEPDIKLVYFNMLNSDYAYFNLLDAKTGKFIDWNGNERTSLDLKLDLIEKLKDHWAYKELKIMAERNIIDLEKTSVNDKVTKKDFIKMMTLAKGNIYYVGTELQELRFIDIDKSDPDYRYLQLAVEHGLINNDEKPLEVDKYITREEMAEILIKAVSLDNVASIEGIYHIPVYDKDNISKDRIGHVALAYGLGIIKGRGKNYFPKEEVNLAEVAVAIYRTMEVMGNSFR